ncbi:MAG: DNA polymerase IV, partial [Nitrosopumilus sp.]|nr:DNA polymerase IV [Nitrosopumilus sp.]
MGTRVVFHIDFDYFYAQCEETRSPELKTKPVCVCVFSDRGGDSGAVATANYTARKYGVKSGIPITFAKKRLEERKDAVFLPVDFDFYSEI